MFHKLYKVYLLYFVGTSTFNVTEHAVYASINSGPNIAKVVNIYVYVLNIVFVCLYLRCTFLLVCRPFQCRYQITFMCVFITKCNRSLCKKQRHSIWHGFHKQLTENNRILIDEHAFWPFFAKRAKISLNLKPDTFSKNLTYIEKLSKEQK